MNVVDSFVFRFISFVSSMVDFDDEMKNTNDENLSEEMIRKIDDGFRLKTDR